MHIDSRHGLHIGIWIVVAKSIAVISLIIVGQNHLLKPLYGFESIGFRNNHSDRSSSFNRYCPAIHLVRKKNRQLAWRSVQNTINRQWTCKIMFFLFMKPPVEDASDICQGTDKAFQNCLQWYAFPKCIGTTAPGRPIIVTLHRFKIANCFFISQL